MALSEAGTALGGAVKRLAEEQAGRDAGVAAIGEVFQPRFVVDATVVELEMLYALAVTLNEFLVDRRAADRLRQPSLWDKPRGKPRRLICGPLCGPVITPGLPSLSFEHLATTIRRTLEKAGVIFVELNGDGPSVRLRKNTGDRSENKPSGSSFPGHRKCGWNAMDRDGMPRPSGSCAGESSGSRQPTCTPQHWISCGDRPSQTGRAL